MERGIIVPMMLPAFPDNPCAGPTTDEQVKVTTNDTTAGFLGSKIAAGTNVSLTTLNSGANEQLQINVTDIDEKVKVSANDTTTGFLATKLQAGNDVTFTTQNPGGDEKLRITPSNDKVRVSANDTQHQYLGQKLSAGTNITLTTLNPGANESLQINAANAPVTSVNTQTGAVTLTNTDVGAAATVHTHDAGDIVSGTVNTARLASGTANSTTFLRGDQTWATPAGGVTGFTGSQNVAAPNNTVNASRLLVDAVSTNADAVIQPKGTGALLAQLPDSTATGGNKRGLIAVDLQLARTAATQVASGQWAVICGGNKNTANSNYSAVLGGESNTASGQWSAMLGGFNSTASGAASISGGDGCVASGSTAIALGGASAASANRAVAIGYGNVANAFGSVAIGESNTASNTNSLAFGKSNVSSQPQSIALGLSNTVGGGVGSCGIGQYNTVTGSTACGIGNYNQIASTYSFGHGNGSYTYRMGVYAHSTSTVRSYGDVQYERWICRADTTNAAATLMTIDGSASGSAQLTITSNTTWVFDAIVNARRTDVKNQSAGWLIRGVMANNNGTTAFVGVPTITVIADDSAGTWIISVSADDTNDRLNITVTGETGKTIAWGAFLNVMRVAG